MRAIIREGVKFPADVKHRDALAVEQNGFALARRQVGDI
jgi:hypothetical protein